jgi:RNA polymerase sigma factor (sigma-70 family)
VNVCRDRIRWLRRRPRESILAEGPEPPGSVDGVVDGVAEEVGQRRSVIEALRGLPASQRHVVVLRFLEDLSVAETADLLGISQGTVKSYTARALSSLRVTLDDTLDDTPGHTLDDNAAPGACGTTEVFHAH